MTDQLILVRHAQVANCFRGLCYGRSDVPLGPEGEAISLRLAATMARWPIRHLLTSGLSRTGWLADQVAVRTGLNVSIETALQERDFGTWELRSWDDIYAEVGEAMHGLIHQPTTYRPPGGETTAELQIRVLEWFDRRPREGLTVVVTHGGPIAAIRGTLQGKAPVDWVDLIPPTGTWVTLEGIKA